MWLRAKAFGGLCALGATLLPGASLAQEGGVLLTFGLENRTELSSNSSLSVPAEGSEISNVTLLSFGLRSETALDRLEFKVQGGIIAQDTPDGSEVKFGRTALNFAYHREVPAAVFDITADYRSDDVDAFGGDLGTVGEPGTRSSLTVASRLETGRTSGVGLIFGLAYDQTTYQDTTDPDLSDNAEIRGDVAAILRFSELATGRIGVRFRHREEENPGTTTTDARTAFLGLDYAISPRATLAVELGYSQTDTEEFDITDRTSGPDATIRLSYDMPVGSAYAQVRVTTDADEGRRETFEIGRALEVQRDTFSARLGVTHADAAGTDLIGGVEWTRALPDGSFGLTAERRVAYDTGDDVTVTTSIFSLNWTKSVTELSSILVDMRYELNDSSAERIEQVSFGAGLNHKLTADWNLSSGVGYTVRRDGDGRAESPNLYLSLRREFQVRP